MMILPRIQHLWLKMIVWLLLLFPLFAQAHLLSITPTTPFPSTVRASSTTVAVFTIKNLATQISIAAIDQSIFPEGSGLSIIASTCGNFMAPLTSCTLSVQLVAPATGQVINAEIREWAKPSVDGVRYPFSVTVVPPPQFTITPNAGPNGSIAPNTPQIINQGGSATFTATPNSGFQIFEWFVDGVFVQSGGSTFTLNNINANHVINVTFEVAQFTVTPSAGANGSINPSTPQVVDQGSSINFIATPDAGFQVDQWFVDGNAVQTGGTTFTLTNVTSNTTVNVTFTIAQFTVTPSAGPNGSINPNTPQTVNQGSDITFTATPNAGFLTYQWFVDGSGTPAQTGGNTFTLTNVTANQTVSVIFRLAIPVAVGTSFQSSPSSNTLYPIAYNSGDGGTNWDLSANFPPPSLIQTQGQLASVNCIFNLCATVGSSINSAGNFEIPLIYNSTDGGSSWVHANTFLPSPTTQGRLNGINCQGTNCVTVGIGTVDSFVTSVPLVYLSANNGSSWGSGILLSPPPGASSATLKSVSCVLPNCVAVGEFTNVTRFPLAYTSNNSGSSWSFSNTINIPGGQTDGFLTSVTCTNNICNAVGATLAAGVATPIPYISINSGVSWFTAGNLAPPAGEAEALLFSVACAGSNCVAVGNSTNLVRSFPVAYTSSDGGSTWGSAINAFVLPGTQANGILNSVTCNGTNCVAVGFSSDAGFNNLQPLAYTSTNSGNSWSQPSGDFKTPSPQDQAFLNGVNGGGTGAGFTFNQRRKKSN